MLRTHLIPKDHLLQILKTHEYTLTVFGVGSNPPWLKLLIQRQQLSLDALDPAGEKSAMSMERDNTIPFQFLPTPLFRHVTPWRREEQRIQLSYM